MIYTLTTWALWLLGAAIVGGVVGWLLRARRASSATAAAARHAEQTASRFDSLEVVAQERDRLRAELVELRRSAAAGPEPIRQPRSRLEPRPAAIAGDSAAERAAAAERERLAAALGERENAIRELRVRLWNDEVKIRELEDRLRRRSVPKG